MAEDKLLKEFDELKKDNEILRQKLSKLEGKTPEKGQTAESTAPATDTPSAEIGDDWRSDDIHLTDSDLYNDIKIDDDYGILICSLIDHHLVLREQQKGGKIYTFTKFGQKKHIPFASMEKIIEYNRSLHEKGCFAILTQRFLDKFGLKNQALPLGSMSRMIEGSVPADEFITIYESAPEYQRKAISDQMIRKLMDDPKIYSSYFLAKIENELGLNLYERSESNKATIEAYKGEAKQWRS